MAQASTIIALGTPEGEGALALLRLSGPQAIVMVDKCFHSKRLSDQSSHTLHVGKIVDEDQVLDEVVVGLFRAPHSYTGEDMVEISCHGSPYVIRSLFLLFTRLGAQAAKAGEFTQRAFLNKKMDLAQAEAVAALIAAETEAAHRVAIEQMKGTVSQKIKAFRTEILDFAALLELELDFSEEDLQFAKREELRSRLSDMRSTLQDLLSDFSTAQAFKEGVQVVIAGPPNAGKSTLFNALLAEEKAMVSPIAGTTRDYIEGNITLQGTRFRLTDTAGLRKSTDPLEQEGVQRSQSRIDSAQLLLWILDLSPYNKTEIAKQQKIHSHPKRPLLLIGNKSDLLSPDQQHSFSKIPNMLLISAKHKTGLRQLKEKMYAYSVGRGYRAGVWISHVRHYQLLKQAEEALARVETGTTQQQNTELLASDLREALRAFGEITGDIYSEELLQHIFSRFCIGK